jgi:MinD superfamily P-loop ATPase
MRIAVASGKGGTGKTTVALALASTAGADVLLRDCDVEEPNCHLFISTEQQRKKVYGLMPVIDKALCTSCGKCGKICQFNAIAVLGDNVLLFPELCHGCGGCVRVCPTGALKEVDKEIGEIGICRKDDLSLIDGHLSIGQAMSPPLIRAVKNHGGRQKYTIVDCPPGTSCPMVTAVRDADFVLLVTEPTPFGLHDLTLAVDTLRELKLPMGVIINRADSGDDKVKAYCKAEGIPVMLEIPHRRDIAMAYSRGETMLQAAPELGLMFRELLEDVENRVSEVKK